MPRNCTALIAIFTLANGCIDPQCPSGYVQKGDTCYRCRPTGVDGGACVVGDAGAYREEHEAGSRSGIDSGSPGAEDASEDAASATCNPREGSRTCTCEPGFADVNGDGTVCTDKCSLAECDPNASCSLVAGEPVCACDSPYVGNGKTCAFDETCALLGCDTNADCEVSGATTRSCKCRPGFTGSGTQCTNVNECAMPDICAPTGSCSDTLGSFSCACQPGFSGTRCEVNGDDCTPNPCQNGGSCIDGANAYSCTCPTGYTGARCELEICGTTLIISRAQVDANRLCAEFDGTLAIAVTGLSEITASDFPYLTKVTELQIVGSYSGTGPFLRSVTLAKLREVGEGGIILQGGADGPVEELNLPALTTIGGRGLELNRGSTRVLDLPVLMTVDGGVRLAYANKLCTLNMRRITQVKGNLTLTRVPHISELELVTLRQATLGTITESMIGCCFPIGSDQFACQDFVDSQGYCDEC